MVKNIFASLVFCLVSGAGFAQEGGASPLPITAAHAWVNPTYSMLLDAARAGSRIVAVGEHGIIVLSDDAGKTFRQASAVPASATLSAVYFSDAEHGWAVGQWGVILASIDGGEHWTLQRSDTSIDQPLFSVYFKDAQHGWAVGLWSLMLATQDGGRSWSPVTLPAPPGGGKADRNLYKIFANHEGHVFVVAEQGTVLRSRDQGASWEYRSTGNKGSLWAGTVAADDTLLVGGLLGHLYLSHDDGDTWTAIDSGSSGSITDLVSSAKQIIGVGLDGFVIRDEDGAGHFKAVQRHGREPLTSVLVSGSGVPLLFSESGILSAE